MTAVVPDPVAVGARTPVRTATPRRYLMCPPTHFAVEYAINPWMLPGIVVDRRLALAQWKMLRRIYLDLGHRVDLLAPVPGLPDMVYAANGATVVDGTVLAARFRHPQRAAEAVAHATWFRRTGSRVVEPEFVNEGEGDLLVVGSGPDAVILAGHGFRTDPRAHAEAARVFGREIVSLELVDPRYYHLDTAIAVLSGSNGEKPANIAYLPEAFSPGSQAVLRQLYPNAVIANIADGEVLGLNAVSDGHNVVLPVQATNLAAELSKAGYRPVPVDVSELRLAGGGPKCCTLELRP